MPVNFIGITAGTMDSYGSHNNTSNNARISQNPTIQRLYQESLDFYSIVAFLTECHWDATTVSLRAVSGHSTVPQVFIGGCHSATTMIQSSSSRRKTKTGWACPSPAKITQGSDLPTHKPATLGAASLR
ncbi:hypothetical protein ACZ87_01020 [Candidatus Erwinia dacicola]|uniref:Uncharacterized protein n=1 Tax=Candidatus Erwinia dacicola TaxID=252393 RepID=A0A328TRH1_9GAMM|nr:hypothetical protein ACZ87_01020 [Candidatus Erwinia dacicola]